MSAIPAPIINRFAPWSRVPMWTLCNAEKQPINLNGNLLQWKQNPGDDINTLDIIQSRLKESFGFGCILGLQNSLVCFDFDHALDEHGSIINPKVREFIELLGTFTEISSSGRGLHAFVAADIKEGETISEYGFKKSFCDGKCYPSRFIKMTGNCLPEYDLPVQILSKSEFGTIERKLSVSSSLPSFNKTKTPSQNKILPGSNWDEILSESGIVHIRSQYYGKARTYPDGITKTAIESYRIPCPNRTSHTDFHKRQNKFGPDAAILTMWDDGTCSLSCNHNACNPANRPNLLKMLWEEIRASRIVDAKQVTSQYAEVLS